MDSTKGFMSLIVVWFLFLSAVHNNLSMGRRPAHGTRRDSQQSAAEITALTTFKKNIKDPNGVFHDWEAGQSAPCTWTHIACDGNYYVTEVNLLNTGLSGTISVTLGDLPNLQYLRLNGNQFHGKIPKELGKLGNLVNLDLSFNKLDGPIPDEVGKMKKLRFLFLNNNKLSGRIPVEHLIALMFVNLQTVTLWPNKYLCNPLEPGTNNCTK